MPKLYVGYDAHNVAHFATRQYPSGKITVNPLCWVMRKLPLLRIVRRVRGAVPTCLWCVALRDRR